MQPKINEAEIKKEKSTFENKRHEKSSYQTNLNHLLSHSPAGRLLYLFSGKSSSIMRGRPTNGLVSKLTTSSPKLVLFLAKNGFKNIIKS